MRRHDYDPSTRIISLRMPGPVHEAVASRVATVVRGQLGLLSKDIRSPLAAVIAGIEHLGYSGVCFQGRAGLVTKQPDISFWNKGTRYPRVVVEVAYSCRRKNLEQLAHDYITSLPGRVAVVVGIDLPYCKKKSILSVWRATLVKEMGTTSVKCELVASEVCRNPNGRKT